MSKDNKNLSNKEREKVTGGMDYDSYKNEMNLIYSDPVYGHHDPVYEHHDPVYEHHDPVYGSYNDPVYGW